MRFGILNAVSDTETPSQTPFNNVFDNYGRERTRTSQPRWLRAEARAAWQIAVFTFSTASRGNSASVRLQPILFLDALFASRGVVWIRAPYK